MWVLPQLGPEYNQPASNHSHNATKHNDAAAHPWSNECSDGQANDDEYTWYDYYMDQGYTADQSRGWAEWHSNNDNRHNYSINDETYNDAASDGCDSGTCRHNNSDSFSNDSAYTRCSDNSCQPSRYTKHTSHDDHVYQRHRLTCSVTSQARPEQYCGYAFAVPTCAVQRTSKSQPPRPRSSAKNARRSRR